MPAESLVPTIPVVAVIGVVTAIGGRRRHWPLLLALPNVADFEVVADIDVVAIIAKCRRL